MKTDRLKGNLELLLLSTVAAVPAHGYTIVRSLRERSEGLFDLPEGTVYPALHQLESSGLLESEWVSTGGRSRKIYSITGKGEARLSTEQKNWQRFSVAVGSVINRRTAWQT
jgi:DNA-binding PadR family transcriptional regulator